MIITHLNNNIKKIMFDKQDDSCSITFKSNVTNTFQVFSPFYSQSIKNYVYPQINTTPQAPILTGNTLNDAMNELQNIVFYPQDIKYMQSLGVNVRFNNGKEIAEFIKNNKIKVEFDKMDCEGAHAQWDKENNRITINEKYRNTKNPLEIVAISEAICHEGGHAKDADDISSIKEEFDCLALNTLANRYHRLAYPELFKQNSDAAILKDGVNLYTELFFDDDSIKERLANRVIEKYGDLPLESPNHAITVNSPVLNNIMSKLKRTN